MDKAPPQFILDYLDAFAKARPNNPLPKIWDRGNGWVHYEYGGVVTSLRRSQVERLTSDLKAQA